MGILGAHVGISGGIHLSIGRAKDLTCECFQVFSRNQRQWNAPPLKETEVRLFWEELCNSGMPPPVIHASYLLNICSPDPDLFERSVSLLQDELHRGALLGASGVVIHPGAHMGKGEAEGVRRGAEGIVRVFETVERAAPLLLLETTAGQGTSMGHTFEQLRDIAELSGHNDRIGICLDTCHVHASGHDISREDGYETMMDEIGSVLGKGCIKAIHLNDSIKGSGSRVDRHTNIGEGALGLVPFELLVNDKRFKDVPMILETPGGDEGYRKDLRTLRGLVHR